MSAKARYNLVSMVQNALLSALYGLIAVAVWRAGVRFPVLFAYAAISVAYQWIAVRLNVAGGIPMLVLLLLAAAEAAWWSVKNERPGRVSLIIMSVAVAGALAILLSGGSGAFLSFRTASTGAAFVALLTLALVNEQMGLRCAPIARTNLRLMTTWLGIRAISAATFDFYATDGTWNLFRWAYAGLLIPIAAAYLWQLQRVDKQRFQP